MVIPMPVPSFITSFATNKVTVTDLESGRLNPVILIDVRSPEEYAQDRIGRSLLIPLEEIQTGQGVSTVQKVAQANSHPNQPEPTIILYCEICPGAIRAYQKLQKTGLNLAVLYGGITAWRQNIPMARDAEILDAISAPTAWAYSPFESLLPIGV